MPQYLRPKTAVSSKVSLEIIKTIKKRKRELILQHGAFILTFRLKFLKKKWQRACGTSNHSTPQSLPTHHSVPSYPPSLPPVRHSSTPGTTTLAPPLYRSPGRINSRLGGTSMGSPPVRDRVVSGSSNGVLNGASNYISPQSYR